jgi:ABC-type nitrate/sulfonate/bicarbonate transport system permease component
MRAWLLSALLIAALGLAWQGAVTLGEVPTYLMPTPAETFSRVLDQRALLLEQSGRTLGTAAAGLAVSATLAIALAAAFTSSATLTRAALPLVIALRTAPLVALAPVITLIVGRGFATGVIVVCIASFFPILVNAMRGLAAVERNAFELMHVLGASRWQAMRLLRFPSALPHLFAGLRIAASSAILGAMLAEWITGHRGLGFLILDSAELRDVELLWATIIVATTLALTVFWLTALAERLCVFWTDASQS